MVHQQLFRVEDRLLKVEVALKTGEPPAQIPEVVRQELQTNQHLQAQGFLQKKEGRRLQHKPEAQIQTQA